MIRLKDAAILLPIKGPRLYRYGKVILNLLKTGEQSGMG